MVPPYLPASAGCLILAALSAFAIHRHLRKRPTPEERERLRRLSLHATGKLGSGQIRDVDAFLILYSYVVAGVEYSASQDVAALESLLPDDRMLMIGHVGIKFDPRNPANSIVMCEQWSGLGRVPLSRARELA